MSFHSSCIHIYVNHYDMEKTGCIGLVDSLRPSETIEHELDANRIKRTHDAATDIYIQTLNSDMSTSAHLREVFYTLSLSLHKDQLINMSLKTNAKKEGILHTTQ